MHEQFICECSSCNMPKKALKASKRVSYVKKPRKAWPTNVTDILELDAECQVQKAGLVYATTAAPHSKVAHCCGHAKLALKKPYYAIESCRL